MAAWAGAHGVACQHSARAEVSAGGAYINSVPIITANWTAQDGQQWTVPLGLAVGHIFHLRKLPVNTQIGAYYNVVHPTTARTGS